MLNLLSAYQSKLPSCHWVFSHFATIWAQVMAMPFCQPVTLVQTEILRTIESIAMKLVHALMSLSFKLYLTFHPVSS